jgi:guanylate kinase
MSDEGLGADAERPVGADAERPVGADAERPRGADAERPVGADAERPVDDPRADPTGPTEADLDADRHVSDDPGRPDYTIDGAPGAMLIILSGPSGVGKDTIIDELRRHERERGLEDRRHYVVTVTTRAPREGEVDGVDYHFVGRDEFLRLRDARGFLEANEVHGNWYGSPRDQVRAALATGRDVILKIDVQGAQVVKEQVSQALLIFVIPPSMEALFQRLRARATETADELELRQRNAALEIARQNDYDRIVTNETGQVTQTAMKINKIIAKEHRRHPTRRVRV